MKKPSNLFFLIWMFTLLPFFSSAQTIELGNWTYHETGTNDVKKALVPGCVHLDLLREKKIPDPFVNDNEKKVQWVGERDWTYSCTFNCDSIMLSQPQIDLLFEGLDTYAAVYLNDSLILKADNMFRSWRIPVRNRLKKGNTLKVEFSAPEKTAALQAKSLKYTLPEGLRSFTRKAQYHYGWDWGPKILTCGIWKPVKLIASDDLSLLSMRIQQKKLSGNTVQAEAIVKISSTQRRKTIIQLREPTSGMQLMQEVVVDKGQQTIRIPFLMENINRWQPNRKGAQVLYTFTCNIENDSTRSLHCSTGFRDLELIRVKDTIGTSFGFRINGRDVFVRGANMIPPDVFLSRLKIEELESLVVQARDANMNMLRVWGGGVYLPDEFYDLCDRYGIMVWQDFMFACSMVPGGEDFVSNVRAEAIEQIERLSSHPCIALWCGNNESDEGWNNWGWQKQFAYSAADSSKIWNDYEVIFHQILPELVDSLDPLHTYWPSSPSKGWGRKESITEGDCHYWGVWWGMEPFEIYRKKTGRFMSEYGFQAMPDAGMWKGFSDTLSVGFSGLRNHQKHPRGFETIDDYMKRYFGMPDGFSDYTYVSQLQQGYGLKIAFDAHRSRYPQCKGTLYWQLNDCWPSISWSSLDVREHPKLSHYTAKQSFDSLFIGIQMEDGKLKTPLHFDGLSEVSLTIRLLCIDTRDDKFPVILDEKRMKLYPDTFIQSCITWPLSQLQNIDTSHTLYLVEAEDNFHFTNIYRNYFHPVLPKNLHLYPAELTIIPFDSTSVVVRSETFAYGVYLYDDAGLCSFSENGFHLQPLEMKRVMVKGGNPEKIKVKCLNNIQLK